MLALLACSALLAVGPERPPTPSAAPARRRQAYQEARAQAGRSPDDQVRLALWCEAHGLPAERTKHLALAVLADPRNAAARGLMGLVAHEGRWRRPEAVADQLKADPDRSATLAEYELKRQKSAYTADAQWALGLWAEEHGLPEQARAHLTAVIRLDPSREAAWKKLGYKKHDGRWVTDAQLALEKAELEAQKAADRKWKPLLEKYKGMLDQPSKREEAEAALAEVTDPRAVPMIGRVFATGATTQSLAARLLGQIDSPGSSKALAFLAVFAKSAESRRAATETLRRRDPREYANLLITLIRKPIRYEVKPTGGPGSPGELFVEGEKANLRRLYAPTSAFQPGDAVTIDQFGQPVVRRVLSAFAYSRGGVPFSPRVLTGVSGSFQDFYSSSVMGLGNLSFSGAGSGITAAQLDALKAGHLPAASTNPRANGPSMSAALAGPFFGGAFGTGPRDFASITQADIPLDQAIAETRRSALVSQQQLAGDAATLDAQNQPIR